MDLLLIYPSLTKEESYGGKKVKKNIGGFLPPLGIASLAAYLLEKGFSVEILDPLMTGINDEQVGTYVKEKNPKIIGISCLTPTYKKAKEYVKIIRNTCPDTLIILGGHHSTLFGSEAIKEEDLPVDLLVYGEGELTLAELMEFFKKNEYDRKAILKQTEKLQNIQGLIFKAGGKVIKTQPRPLIENIDMLPFPARHLLPMKQYVPLPIEYKRLPVVNMMISRGCPFNCTYCSTHAAFGWKVRIRSPEKVIEEIKKVIKEYGARQISFWDDVLTINHEWLTKICDSIINEKLDIVWNCYAHVNTINEQILKKMKEAGCFCIWYGIEAGDEELLKIINKKTTLESIRKAIKLTQQQGIEVRGLFMLGLPGETPELAQKTIDFAKELDCDYAQFSITTPHVGTQLFEDAKKYGSLNVDFSKFTQHEAVFVPYGYKDKEEIKKMQKKAMRQFYLRPKFILKHLFRIKSIEDIIRYYKAFKILFALG